MSQPIFLRQLISDLVAECETKLLAGPITGFSTLDAALGGRLPVGLNIFQAAPGEGKSALALTVSAQCRTPALFVTSEMRPVELFRRLIARETKTSLDKLGRELDGRAVTELARQTASKLPALAILDSTTKFVPPDAVLDAAISVQCHASAETILVVLDSLQVWSRGLGGNLPEYELMTRGVKAISEIALQLPAPVLVISHRNRAGQKQGGLFAAKGTGDIEYAAETVIELARVNDAQPDGRGEVPIRITVLKNRHGAAGVEVSLRFCGHLQSFREVNG